MNRIAMPIMNRIALAAATAVALPAAAAADDHHFTAGSLLEACATSLPEERLLCNIYTRAARPALPALVEFFRRPTSSASSRRARPPPANGEK
jgi:hypothetical protein